MQLQKLIILVHKNQFLNTLKKWKQGLIDSVIDFVLAGKDKLFALYYLIYTYQKDNVELWHTKIEYINTWNTKSYNKYFTT